MVNFIGVGVQRSATSWLYSCLYEHPEICAPEKEIHFFSRPRYEEQGIDWYKEKFRRRCSGDSVTGEFSTSYLYHEEAIARIHKHFPEAKILVSLRNPADRAFSQYLLHTKVGWLDPEKVSFEEFIETESSAIEQSMYTAQLERLYTHFPKEQVHVMCKEEIDSDPAKVLRDLFTFLEVDPTFTPSFINRTVNSGNRPKRLWINQSIQYISNALYKSGFDKIVFAIKKTGLPALIRRNNSAGKAESPEAAYKASLKERFRDDVQKTETLIGKNLSTLWDY